MILPPPVAEEKTAESEKVMPSTDAEPSAPVEKAQTLVTVTRLQTGDTYEELSAYCADLVNQWTSANRGTADALYRALTENRIALSGRSDMLPYDFQIGLVVGEKVETFYLWLDFYKEGSTAIVSQSERALPEWKIPAEQADQLRKLLAPLKVPIKTVAQVDLPNGETAGEGKAFHLPYMLDYCFAGIAVAKAEPETPWDCKLIYTSYGLSHEYLLWLDGGEEICLVEDEQGQRFDLAEDQKRLLNLFFLQIPGSEE